MDIKAIKHVITMILNEFSILQHIYYFPCLNRKHPAAQVSERMNPSANATVIREIEWCNHGAFLRRR